MSRSPVSPTKDGITLQIHAQAGAKTTGWAGLHGHALKLRVAARPVEGEANKAICKFVAEFFDVPKSAVNIAHGESGRAKVVYISGNAEALLRRVNRILIEPQRPRSGQGPP